MNQSDYMQALILIKAAQVAIGNRRTTEMMCQYPPEYGGDAEILKGMDKFLANPHIAEDLEEAMDFYNKIMKKEKK